MVNREAHETMSPRLRGTSAQSLVEPGRFFSTYRVLDDRMCEISERMLPFEKQIDELSVRSIAALRAVALKELRCSMPISHDAYTLSDGNGGDLALLWGSLHFVGLGEFAEQVEQRIKGAVETIGRLTFSLRSASVRFSVGLE